MTSDHPVGPYLAEGTWMGVKKKQHQGTVRRALNRSTYLSNRALHYADMALFLHQAHVSIMRIVRRW